MSCEDAVIEGINVQEDVLRPYHRAFVAAYTKQHGSPVDTGDTIAAIDAIYPFSQLEKDFELATLDFARWVMGCRLGGETPEKYAKRRADVDPNLGTYRRSEVVMKLLMSLVQEFLPRVEQTLE